MLLDRRVLTLERDDSNAWVDGAREKCRWGEKGTIITYSNSHGLCFEVHHDEGGMAWYNPGELQLIQTEETSVSDYNDEFLQLDLIDL